METPLGWINSKMLLLSVAILSLVGYRVWKRNARRRVSWVDQPPLIIEKKF